MIIYVKIVLLVNIIRILVVKHKMIVLIVHKVNMVLLLEQLVIYHVLDVILENLQRVVRVKRVLKDLFH